MENASKALIIAASVLIAILIIALGVTIFNKAQSAADTTSLDITEINMFNSKFERYAGEQLGSQVKSLISFAISNATTNKDEPSKLPTVETVDFEDKDGKKIKITANASDKDELTKIRNAVISTHTYTVECQYADTGLIYKITITY